MVNLEIWYEIVHVWHNHVSISYNINYCHIMHFTHNPQRINLKLFIVFVYFKYCHVKMTVKHLIDA
jgi:hypothetical protein